MLVACCFQREDVSHDSTVVGPAGGTLLFLITPNHILWRRVCAAAELSERGPGAYTVDSEMSE